MFSAERSKKNNTCTSRSMNQTIGLGDATVDLTLPDTSAEVLDVDKVTTSEVVFARKSTPNYEMPGSTTASSLCIQSCSSISNFREQDVGYMEQPGNEPPQNAQQNSSTASTGASVDNLDVVSSEILYECTKCKKRFKYEKAFQKHLETTNCGSILVCYSCNRKFKNQKILKQHAQSHLKNSLTCELCQKIFISEARLIKHKKFEHENKICPFCKKTFKNGNTLRTHKHKVHKNSKKEKKADKRNCPKCKKSLSKSWFNKHIKTCNIEISAS